MLINKQHIGFKISAFLLVFALLTPIAIKLAHSFEHKHSTCSNYNSANLHECETDCDFYKYNLKQFNIAYHHYSIDWKESQYPEILSETYKYFYNQKQLSFSLRAPPVFV